MKEHDKPNRIREWKKRRGITTKELAERVGTSVAQITRMETGTRNVNFQWILRLSRALEITPGELMLQKDNPLLPSEREAVMLQCIRSEGDLLFDIVEAVIDAYVGRGLAVKERELLRTLRSTEDGLAIKAEAVINFHNAVLRAEEHKHPAGSHRGTRANQR